MNEIRAAYRDMAPAIRDPESVRSRLRQILDNAGATRDALSRSMDLIVGPSPEKTCMNEKSMAHLENVDALLNRIMNTMSECQSLASHIAEKIGE